MWIQCLSYMQNYHDGIRKSCKYVADNNILVEFINAFSVVGRIVKDVHQILPENIYTDNLKC